MVNSDGYKIPFNGIMRERWFKSIYMVKKIITYEEELVYSRPKVVTLTRIIKNLMEVIISRDKVAVTG